MKSQCIIPAVVALLVGVICFSAAKHAGVKTAHYPAVSPTEMSTMIQGRSLFAALDSGCVNNCQRPDGSPANTTIKGLHADFKN